MSSDTTPKSLGQIAYDEHQAVSEVYPVKWEHIGTSEQSGWEAAASAVLAARPAWQDISTAPKDGTTIILGRAERDDSVAISTPGHWQEGYEDGVDYMGCDSGFVDSNYQVFNGGRSFGAGSYRYASSQPTHWQPLPTPPGAAA